MKSFLNRLQAAYTLQAASLSKKDSFAILKVWHGPHSRINKDGWAQRFDGRAYGQPIYTDLAKWDDPEFQEKLQKVAEMQNLYNRLRIKKPV